MRNPDPEAVTSVLKQKYLAHYRDCSVFATVGTRLVPSKTRHQWIEASITGVLVVLLGHDGYRVSKLLLFFSVVSAYVSI